MGRAVAEERALMDEFVRRLMTGQDNKEICGQYATLIKARATMESELAQAREGR